MAAALIHGTSGVIAKLLALPVFCVVILLTRLVSFNLPRRGLPVLETMLTLKLLLLTSGAALAIWHGPFVDGDSAYAIATGMIGAHGYRGRELCRGRGRSGSTAVPSRELVLPGAAARRSVDPPDGPDRVNARRGHRSARRPGPLGRSQIEHPASREAYPWQLSYWPSTLVCCCPARFTVRSHRIRGVSSSVYSGKSKWRREEHRPVPSTV